MTEPVTLELLGKQVKRLRDDVHEASAERLEAQRTMLQILELLTQIDRLIVELRTDFGLAVAHEVDKAINRRFDRIEENMP